jgi:methylmalonyl-CoA/ethylmalonyl-CoA epimerase
MEDYHLVSKRKNSMRLHHVAYVTRSVAEKMAQFSEMLGCRPAGPIVTDEVQGVRIQFMEMSDGSLLELLEPYGERSPVKRHLLKGGGIYHVCFEVDDLDRTLRRLQEAGDAIVVGEAGPAPAINNRRVAFVVTTTGDLFEFVEAL